MSSAVSLPEVFLLVLDRGFEGNTCDISPLEESVQLLL